MVYHLKNFHSSELSFILILLFKNAIEWSLPNCGSGPQSDGGSSSDDLFLLPCEPSQFGRGHSFAFLNKATN